jgi:hypothetical protein
VSVILSILPKPKIWADIQFFKPLSIYGLHFRKRRGHLSSRCRLCGRSDPLRVSTGLQGDCFTRPVPIFGIYVSLQLARFSFAMTTPSVHCSQRQRSLYLTLLLAGKEAPFPAFRQSSRTVVPPETIKLLKPATKSKAERIEGRRLDTFSHLSAGEHSATNATRLGESRYNRHERQSMFLLMSPKNQKLGWHLNSPPQLIHRLPSLRQ